MASYFDAEKYKKYIIKQQGGKLYLMVIGALKAAIDYGVLLGSETTITETEDVIRVHVRIKVLNKHLENFDSLPDDAKIGYYDGVADNPKQGAKGAARLFPLEDAETSALGRALTKVGFNFDTMATADEMKIVEKKTESGYTAAPSNDTSPLVLELRNAMKASGITNAADARKAVQSRYGKPVNELSDGEIKTWISELQGNPASPLPTNEKVTPF